MPIKAKTINATNVVEGVQIVGVKNEADAQLIKAALEGCRDLLASGHSGIEADTITAENVVEGFQFIQDAKHPTLNELRQEFAAKLVALAKDTNAPAEAKAALAAVQVEAKKDKPEPGKLVEGLQKLSSTFKNITDAAPNVLKIARWVPTIVLAVKAWAAVHGVTLP